MRCLSTDIVLQEVPGEISLSLFISGCSLNCKGCHTPEGQDSNKGFTFTSKELEVLLKKYKGLMTCILFYGGEWEELALIPLILVIKKYNLKVCLYTGQKDISKDIKKHLTYLKVGPWVEELGPLSSKTTNQRFLNLLTGEDLTYKFWK